MPQRAAKSHKKMYYTASDGLTRLEAVLHGAGPQKLVLYGLQWSSVPSRRPRRRVGCLACLWSMLDGVGR
jgi:hypothetical protein